MTLDLPHAPNGIPVQQRNWLRQLRQLLSFTLADVASKCDLSVQTYRRLETGGGLPIKFSTCLKASKALGFKVDLMFYPCDHEGRLTQSNCVPDILSLFASAGYRSVLNVPTFINIIFNDEVSDYILQNSIEG